MYHFREFSMAGGLMSYGVNSRHLSPNWHLRGWDFEGENPGELPIIRPTKFELVINMKTAKALGLKVPLTLLVAADEVIE